MLFSWNPIIDSLSVVPLWSTNEYNEIYPAHSLKLEMFFCLAVQLPAGQCQIFVRFFSSMVFASRSDAEIPKPIFHLLEGVCKTTQLLVLDLWESCRKPGVLSLKLVIISTGG